MDTSLIPKRKANGMASRHTIKRGNTTRDGFTLVELLIVITIIVILAGLTVAVVNGTIQGDRIRGGARQMQSAYLGAAAKALLKDENGKRRPVGIRLLLDEADKTTVTSMIYVRQLDPYTQGTISLGRLDEDNDGSADDPPNDGNIRAIRGDDTGWWDLKQQGFLPAVTRIRWPAEDGPWYIVETSGVTATNELLRVTSSFPETVAAAESGLTATARPAVTAFGEWKNDPNAPPPNPFLIDSDLDNYVLELGVAPLENQEPLTLPNGSVIDLDNSFLPTEWFQEQEVATFDSTDPLYPLGWRDTGRMPVTAGQVVIRRYSPLIDPANPAHLDILFSPRGVVAGALAATGKIHLLISEVEDTVLNRRPEDPESEAEQLIMTLFPQTGNVSTHPLFEFDETVLPYIPNLRFTYAETGEVAGR